MAKLLTYQVSVRGERPMLRRALKDDMNVGINSSDSESA